MLNVFIVLRTTIIVAFCRNSHSSRHHHRPSPLPSTRHFHHSPQLASAVRCQSARARKRRLCSKNCPNTVGNRCCVCSVWLDFYVFHTLRHWFAQQTTSFSPSNQNQIHFVSLFFFLLYAPSQFRGCAIFVQCNCSHYGIHWFYESNFYMQRNSRAP